MSKGHRQPDARMEAPAIPSRTIAHLILDAGGNVATEFVSERELDDRVLPSEEAVEALFGAWGHIDAEALLDDLEQSRIEVMPTSVRDGG